MTNRDLAIRIIKTLRAKGFDALLAGGCVRDMLLNKKAKDYDVATSAAPQEVIKLFRRTLKVGAKFGVIMVLDGSHQVEVATFRAETDYSDGRRPDHVTFCDPRTDAARRDFTINGMFYDPIDKKIIDYVQGQKDLEKKIIKTIGSPDERFAEDYLRLLRAIRFSSRLNFDIAPATWHSLCKFAPRISAISAERIAIELEYILTDKNRTAGLKKLQTSKLLSAIFTDFDDPDITRAINTVANLPAKVSFPLVLATLFSPCDTKWAIDKIISLKLSNAAFNKIKFLLTNRSTLLQEDISLAQLKKLLATGHFDDLYEMQKAIQKADRLPITKLTKIKTRAKKLANTDLTPKPLLDGHELIAMGVTPGPTLGKIAKKLYDQQLNENIKTKPQAITWIKNQIKK